MVQENKKQSIESDRYLDDLIREVAQRWLAKKQSKQKKDNHKLQNGYKPRVSYGVNEEEKKPILAEPYL